MLRTATALFSFVLAFLVSTVASAQVTFTDVTDSAGTNLGEGTSRGICWVDFNNDGLLDLFVPTSGSSANRLFMNLGNGTFADIATAVGLNDMANTYCGSWADMDNDGDLDLVTPGSGTTRLWKNNRVGGTDTTFTSIEGIAGITTSGAQMTLWADYNNDGLVDIYSPISNSSTSPDALYRNTGGGIFTNVADSAGVNHQVSGVLEQATHWGDYNKDGYADLFIGNLQSSGPSFFHQNNGNGTFTEIATTLGFQGGGRGGQWVDYNNDGLWDFSQARYLGATALTQIGLFRNNGNGTFTNVATTSGITDGLIIWSLTWADFDNNGFEDVFVCASGQSTTCQLYKNEGNGSFTNATTQAGLSGLVMLLAAWGDYDNNGNMDLFTSGATSAGNHLFKNNGDSTRHWLKVNLVGTRSNRSAIGAQIDVKAGALRMMREINTGIGWRPQNSLTAHFGLNTNTSADSIVVRWPRGGRSVLTNVSADTLLTIIEPSIPPRPAILVSPDTITLIGQHLFRDTLYVRNLGQAPLVVDTIYPGPRFHPPVMDMFHAVPDSFVVQPGNSQAVVIYLDIPVTSLLYMFNDSLYIHSNDPVDSVVIVFFRGDFPSDVDAGKAVPLEFGLHQNWPNPFNPTTIIRFSIPNSGHSTLRVFDVLGREVATLVNEIKPAGNHDAEWDARNVSSGLYFYRLQTGMFTETRKMLLLK